MKKIFTLLTVLMTCGTIGWAQDVDNTFQFTDMEGNVVADGSVITVNTATKNESGELLMVVPLKVKNVSGEKAAVSMYEVIDQKPNGGWQTCAFGNCMQLTGTGYSPKNIMTADYHADIQTEWIPQEGAYATWEATLQIHVFNIVTKTMFGQVFESAGDEIIGYGPKVTVRFEYKEQQEQQEKVWWGYVSTDDAVSGLGVQAAETYDCAAFYPGSNENVKGKTINGVRFVMNTANVKDVKVWLTNKLTADVTSQALQVIDVTNPKIGINEVQLTTPYEVGNEGIYVGYSFTITSLATQADSYPVATAGDARQNALWIRTSSSVPNWGDLYQQDFGCLFLMLQLSGDFPYKNGANVAVNDLGDCVGVSGNTAKAYLPITNMGTRDITNIDFTVASADGTSTTQHFDLDKPLVYGSTKVLAIDIPADEAAGTQKKTLTITKVNGQANEYAATQATLNMLTVSKLVDRSVAIEEYTGTTCGWCPRGIVAMEKIRQTFGDKAIGIAIHRYTSSKTQDAMYISEYNHVSFGGAPSCRIDRGPVIDPYYGSSASIIDDINFELSIPAKAAISVSGKWDVDSVLVEATATIENVLPGENYKIEYVLVADGLTGTTQAWRQYNFYNKAYGQFSSADELPDDLSFLYDTGTVYGNYVAYYPTFNDVAIKVAKSSETTAPGKLADGEIVTNDHTLVFTTDATLLKAIKKDRVSLVALLIDSKGAIANAARVNLSNNSEAGISQVERQQTSAVERYSLEGRKLQGAHKGLTIIRMADGTARKVVVRK